MRRKYHYLVADHRGRLFDESLSATPRLAARIYCRALFYQPLPGAWCLVWAWLRFRGYRTITLSEALTTQGSG